MRGPWRIAIALIGVAAIAVGVVEIVSRSRARSTSTSTTRTLLGKAAFIRRADGICAVLNPQVEAYYRIALADQNGGDSSGARLEITKLETAAGQLIGRIEALGPPAQGAAAVALVLSEYSELVSDAVADTPETNAAAAGLQAEIASQAAQFGFHVCGLT
jgi:hypothetical protein